MRLAGLLLVLVPCAALAAEAAAQDRLSRTYAHDHGLTGPPVWAVAQDSSGFLWVAAEAGLYRFDGTRMRRWADDVLREAVMDVVAGAGRVVAVDRTGRAFEVTGSGAVPLTLPAGLPLLRNAAAASAAFDTDGGLWLLGMGAVVRLGEDGRAVVIGAADLAGQPPRLLARSAVGGAFVVTDSALWRVRPDSPPRRLYDGFVISVDEPDPGRILLLVAEPGNRPGRVVELRDGSTRDIIPPGAAPGGRAISVRERGGTVFVALDRYLLIARPGEELVTMGRDEGVESGGPLFVDREGSLWLGSFVGLHQYPEPETRLWAEPQGLPSRHTRFLARSGDVVWVMTWAGPGYLRQGSAGWTATTARWDSRSSICMDAAGGAWASAGGAVVELRGTDVRRWPVEGAAVVQACTPARDGGVWIGTSGGLHHMDRERQRMRRVITPVRAAEDALPAGLSAPAVAALLHDSRDRVWIADASGVCQASGARLSGDVASDGPGVTPATWQCTSPLTAGVVTGMVELPGGRLWMSSNQQGLFAFDGAEWRPHPLEGAPTRTIHRMAASPRGGMWIAGAGIVVRVAESEDGGLQVLERPGPFHGLPVASGSAVLEDDDGTLWIATGRGVFQVPASARFPAMAAPATALVDARIDDRGLPLDAPLVLRHDRNRLELNFAALSFRDRSLLRHQVRLGPGEPWSMSAGEPSFRWVDLRPGEYQVEYRASVDGTNWSEQPIRFAFVVQPAWYATTWFMLAAGALAALLVWLVYRARLAYLIGLERQRTRIAMDLHDEVGSGLASVGIMAGVLAADGLNAGVRSRTASDIAAAAEDLGNSLSDIVWSLDSRTATMEELAARLAEHGGRMCAAESTTFAARFPAQWPADRPGVAVRRNVLLIGLEALHNAVRHGRARNVTLAMLPVGRRHWELTISDDGAGLPAMTEHANGRGRGLPGMRRRAAEIGAQLTIVAARPSGTIVAVRFATEPASAAHRMIMRVRAMR